MSVLISNGVGITPMIVMAKACTRLNPNRPVYFLHGALDGQYHAFRDEVLAIAQQNPNLQIHFACSRLRPEDEGFYKSTGYLDAALISVFGHARRGVFPLWFATVFAIRQS